MSFSLLKEAHIEEMKNAAIHDGAELIGFLLTVVLFSLIIKMLRCTIKNIEINRERTIIEI